MSASSWQHYIQQQRQYYKTLEPIYNPYLNEYIHFNSTGFKHIVYKTGRSGADIRQRLALLPYVSRAMQTEPVTTRLVSISIYHVFILEANTDLHIKVVAKRTGDRGNLNLLTLYRIK